MLKFTELSSKWCITCIKVTISASNMYYNMPVKK